MEIKFESQSHELATKTLVNALIHNNNLIEIINREYIKVKRKYH